MNYLPQISVFYGIIILIYYNDYNPPHFHAEYNDYEILITINDLSIYKGSGLPPKAFSMVMEWGMLHQEELKGAWNNCSTGFKPEKISPLQ